MKSIIEKLQADDGFWGSLISRFMGYEEIYFPPSEEAEIGKFISEYINSSAEHEILTVTGEINPAYYERDDFKSAIISFYKRLPRKNGYVPFRIISGKSMGKIISENPFLVDLAKDNFVEMYQLGCRPKCHYFCIDGRALFIQEIHTSDELAGTYFIERTHQLGLDYKKRFETLAKKSTLLDFS